MNIELWKKRKKELNITYDQLAELSGVSRRTIAGLFAKQPRYQSTTTATVEAIEKALGISEGKWTDADRAGGISERGKITVNADEMEMLDLYNSIGHKFGKTRQETIKKLLEAMLEEEKK